MVAIGLGVVGVGLGAGLAVAREDAAATWNGDACWDPATGSRATLCADTRSAAELNETGSIVSFVVGGALLAAGAALVIVGGASADETRASATRVACAPGFGSITCGGTF